MAYSNFTNKRPIPSVSTRKSSPNTTNFCDGILTYAPNDTMKETQVRLAQDARFDRVGEYGTRKGLKMLSQAIGQTKLFGDIAKEDVPHASTEVLPLEHTFTAGATIYSIELDIAKNDDLYVIPRLSLYNSQNELVSSSCVKLVGIVGQPIRYKFIFNDAPSFEAGETMKIKIEAQSGSLASFSVSADASNNLVAIVNTAETGQVTNVFEANIEGEKTVLFVFNEKLYRLVNNVPTLIRQLPAGTKKVRFNQDLDEIRYVDGLEKPHIIKPLENWADSEMVCEDLDTGTPLDIKPTNIMDGVADNIIYFAGDPDTEAFWTYPYGYSLAKSPAFTTTETIDGEVGDTLTIQLNTISPNGVAVGDWITGLGSATAEVTAIADQLVSLTIVDTTPVTISSYDKFSVDFYQNFPAIKTGDPLTAMFNLGGVIYMQTRRNKYQMYSQSADTWTQSQSNAQGGTFSQESVVCDLNYAYFANENGIYVFDGASEASLTEKTIQNVYDNIKGKESIVLDLYKNRLYVYYSSKGDGVNDSCLIYNINLRVWESFDTNSFVSATSARQNASGRFLCGHSKFGIIMLNEEGDYSDMGQAIAFNLETGYQHFGATSQLKRITKWRPEFAVAEKPYNIECGYALDFTDHVKYAFSINLKDQRVIGEEYVWDNPSNYGVSTIPTKHTTLPVVNDEFYRCQIRYQHIASFEPVIFRSHTLTTQMQRIR